MTNPQSLNLYAYVRNNPLRTNDPSGHCPGDSCKDLKVEATVVEKPKVLVGEKIEGQSVTGVRGTIEFKMTLGGRPLADAPVAESNVNKTTIDGSPLNLPSKQQDSATDSAGKLKDTVGLLAPSGSKADDQQLAGSLATSKVVFKNDQTLKVTIPGGAVCECTSSRELTNVQKDGKVGGYLLSTTPPVVKPTDRKP